MNSNHNPNRKPLGPLQRDITKALIKDGGWMSVPELLAKIGGGDTARLRAVHGCLRRLIDLRLVKSKGAMHTRRFATTARAKTRV